MMPRMRHMCACTPPRPWLKFEQSAAVVEREQNVSRREENVALREGRLLEVAADVDKQRFAERYVPRPKKRMRLALEEAAPKMQETVAEVEMAEGEG